ncbi:MULTISPECIES: hypothetical protein [Moorena]|uniref:hypothetical protein n=1 Tax=Moorena TaxID=1155738 RepID=UPI0002F91585|nr:MULTISPECIES: hypothetical protein [Moorena]NEQ14304.1 hypothetical protein [Moorena sp. SIO3E2]NEP34890.1 hypothetical protein [Moorena sp. SIO3B2]NEP66383.1 hypothetical protein [Moorena sp. SIO3A5]NEQ11109.1 hypothetical protein [Moorena sp. SIO4E2]NER92096.1 hypothetical protein [Moorena sp. SIO3A2]
MSASPLVKASYRLARAFGWTPQQVQAMTMGQVSIYLQMLDEEVSDGDSWGKLS